MKKKVEKYCIINDEKIENDIVELQSYVQLLVVNMGNVKDPIRYKKMLGLKREAELMIQDLENKKILRVKTMV